MSGHSKWATTHRQKAIIDAKRSSVFTKLSRLITVAAREKGSDINTNFSLRMLVDKARDASMPKDNIDKAIKKGTGEIEGEAFEDLVYEAIGPFNTQFIVKCLTTNKNRSASDIRHLFSKNGGAFSSVAWNFDQKSVIEIDSANIKMDDDLEMNLIENGASDISESDDLVFIYGEVKELQNLKKFLDEKGIPTKSAELKYVAKDIIELNDEQMGSIGNLVDALEDYEDVVDWYGNF